MTVVNVQDDLRAILEESQRHVKRVTAESEELDKRLTETVKALTSRLEAVREYERLPWYHKVFIKRP